MEHVLKEVLKKISPSRKERDDVKQKIDAFLKKIEELKPKATTITLGGSSAKDTWLAGAHDADIFVAFDFKTYQEQQDRLSDILEKTIKKISRSYKRLHGSRDYFQITSGSFIFEIIPILQIKKAKEALNITDVSPLHSKWILKNSTKAQRDQIRLAKAFCKANGLYGAESYIQGFSGYVLEILTLHYGDFSSLLQASRKWKEKEVIDPAHHYPSELEARYSINLSKHSSLIIIDPVDASRNAAAALSDEKFNLFKEKAKKFLRRPDESFFVKKKVNKESLQKQYPKDNLLIVEATPLKGKRDVVGSKLLKVFNHLTAQLNLFSIIDHGWQWNEGEKALMWWVVKKEKIEPYEIRKGPPTTLKEFAKDFKKKNKDVTEKDGVLYASIKRKQTALRDVAKTLLKETYVKERVKTIEILK